MTYSYEPRWPDTYLTAPDGTGYEISSTPGDMSTRQGNRQVFQMPSRPHVFRPNQFNLLDHEERSEVILASDDVSVFVTHGKWTGEAWVPSSPYFNKKGLTIPGMINDYEAVTGDEIDVVMVCKSGASPDVPDTLDEQIGHPTIHPAHGPAAGLIYIEGRDITANLFTEVQDGRIVFDAWKNYRLGNQPK